MFMAGHIMHCAPGFSSMAAPGKPGCRERLESNHEYQKNCQTLMVFYHELYLSLNYPFCKLRKYDCTINPCPVFCQMVNNVKPAPPE